MEAKTITFFILLGLSFLSILLSRSAFKRGRVEARQNRNRRRRNRRRPHLPHVFSEQTIIDAAKHFSRRPTVEFAFDTNVLIDNPYILSKIANESRVLLIISQQVRYELDRLKDHDDKVKHEARIALRDISNLHKNNRLKIVYYNKKFVESQGLRTDVADDLIIGSYLERQQDNKEVIFVTNDNNSRTTARTVNLTPLELDWHKKKPHRQAKSFRPGYFNKVLGIIFLSLAFGLFNGAMNIEPGENLALHIYDEIKTKAKEKNSPTLIEDKKYPFLVENEYGDRYLGKAAKDWGYSAVIDINIVPERSRADIIIATWFDGDIEDKKNELYYEFVTKDDKTLKEDDEISRVSYNVKNYSANRGISVPSLDSNIKFEKITSHESVHFYFKSDIDIEKTINGAKLVLKHKVTDDKIVTIPVKVKKYKE